MRRKQVEHHHGLLFCWNVKHGLESGMNEGELINYVDWFMQYHLLAHFKTEEEELFPIIGMQHPMVVRAVEEHRRIESIYKGQGETGSKLALFIFELNKHILFEEKILFRMLEAKANEIELSRLKEIHEEVPGALHLADASWTTMI